MEDVGKSRHGEHCAVRARLRGDEPDCIWTDHAASPVLAVFSQYDSMFFFGYVQFQAGVGLFLITLAFWMRWRGHFTALRLAALGILSSCQLILPIWVVTLFWASLLHSSWYWTSGDNAAGIARPWRGLLRCWDRCFYLHSRMSYGNTATPEWASVTLKAQHLLIHVLGFNGTVDAAFAAVLLVAAIVVLWKGQIRFHPELGPLAAFFGFLFLGFPYFIGDGPDADTRVFVATFVLALLCCRIRLAQPAGRVLFSVVFVALILRIGYIGSIWIQQDRLIAKRQVF